MEARDECPLPAFPRPRPDPAAGGAAGPDRHDRPGLCGLSAGPALCRDGLPRHRLRHRPGQGGGGAGRALARPRHRRFARGGRGHRGPCRHGGGGGLRRAGDLRPHPDRPAQGARPVRRARHAARPAALPAPRAGALAGKHHLSRHHRGIRAARPGRGRAAGRPRCLLHLQPGARGPRQPRGHGGPGAQAGGRRHAGLPRRGGGALRPRGGLGRAGLLARRGGAGEVLRECLPRGEHRPGERAQAPQPRHGHRRARGDRRRRHQALRLHAFPPRSRPRRPLHPGGPLLPRLEGAGTGRAERLHRAGGPGERCPAALRGEPPARRAGRAWPHPARRPRAAARPRLQARRAGHAGKPGGGDLPHPGGPWRGLGLPRPVGAALPGDAAPRRHGAGASQPGPHPRPAGRAGCGGDRDPP